MPRSRRKPSNSRRYLSMRGNTYWFKRGIPQAIRYLFGGKSDYMVNLRTGNIRAAMILRDEIERDTGQQFKEARTSGTVDLTVAATTSERIANLASVWANELQESARDPVGWTAKVTGRDAASISESALMHPSEMIEAEAEKLGVKDGTRFLNILHGRVEVDHHLDAYFKEAQLAPKTAAERKNLIKRFARWAESESLTLPDIDRATAGRYVSTAIAPLHKATAKKHLGSVKQYWQFLIMRGYVSITDNPWSGQTMPDRRRRVERGSSGTELERPFTADEMKTLLYSQYPEGLTKAYDQQIRDAMRISALSGMRLAEIITLWAEECVLVDDVADDATGLRSYFDIQQGKTSAAARKVPIHPDLLSIVERRLANKGPKDWLFDELQKDKNPSDKFGKRFARFRIKLGVDDQRDGKRRSLVNFHSFRRWFVTESERAGQPESIISAVVGHEEGRKSITLKVYSGGPSGGQKRACVEAVLIPAPKR